MKVLNLRCGHEHRFEGWFASEADYLAQHERQLIACPLCEDTVISRLPSAPRLIASRQRDSTRGATHDSARSEPVSSAGKAMQANALPMSDDVAGGTLQRLQSQWLSEVREMIRNTEDVGDRFSEEARRIHYGEVKERGIRGLASQEDAQALRDEGIEVQTIALPAALKGPVQ